MGSNGGWSPTVADGVVFECTMMGTVYALNASTGTLIWSCAPGGYLYSCPAVADGMVFMGSFDHNVYALDETTGNKIWSYTTGDIVRCSPAVAGGKVFIGSWDNNLYALNETTGNKIWSYRALPTDSCPAVADGMVFIGSVDGTVYAFGSPRDVAVTNVVASETPVTVGDSLSVFVTVRSLGTQSETFSVTGYYGTGEIGFNATTVTLDAGANQTLDMIWNTTNIFPGTYQVGAYATLALDTNRSNNDLQGGYVTVDGLPYKPLYPAATPLNDGVNLTWSAPVRTEVIEYEIFRGTSSDFAFSWPPYGSSGTLNFSDTVSDNFVYYYRTSARYSEGISTPSDAIACARLESFRGVQNILVGVNSLSASPFPDLSPPNYPNYITIQQNFFVFTRKNSQEIMYWCQNCIVKAMNPSNTLTLSQMEIRGPILAYDFGSLTRDAQYREIGYTYDENDTAVFTSTIVGPCLAMGNSVYGSRGPWKVYLGLDSNAYIHTLSCEYPPQSSMDGGYSRPPNFVLVGDREGGKEAWFNSGKGQVSCSVEIGTSWCLGKYIDVVELLRNDGYAQTEEKSHNLKFERNSNGDPDGSFSYTSGSAEEGVFFVPDFGSLHVEPLAINSPSEIARLLVVEAKCPIYVGLCDEFGRCVGYNATSGTVENQIGNAVWRSNLTLLILNPSGAYSVDVIGTDNGTYDLKTSWQDVTGTVSVISDLNGTIVENETQTYHIGDNANVTLTNILPSQTVVDQGGGLQVNATIADLGGPDATFNVTLYANDTVIGTQSMLNVSGWSSMNVCFTWNTAGLALGNYVLWADAEPASGGIGSTYFGGMIQIVATTSSGGGGRMPYMD